MLMLHIWLISERKAMKKILANGVLAILTIGVFIFLVKLIVIDFLVGLFSPLILLLPVPNYLVIPLSLIFLFITILLTGVLFSQPKIKQLFKLVLRQKIPDMGNKRGALVQLDSGVWMIAVVIGATILERPDGEKEEMYVLYSPSVPIPWGGMPVILARKEMVIFLDLSFFQVYEATVSFGRNIPDLLRELKNDKGAG